MLKNPTKYKKSLSPQPKQPLSLLIFFFFLLVLFPDENRFSISD